MKLREEIPLTEEECAVVMEDIAAYEQLLARPADAAALDGKTPRDLQRLEQEEKHLNEARPNGRVVS